MGKYTIDGLFAGVVYKGIIKRLLYQFKYSPFLTDLQTVLTDVLYEELIQDEIFAKVLLARPILVPIPLSRSKLRKRGYNQSEILAKNLGKRFGLSVENLLIRTKETKPQYGLKREERIENMKGAFSVRKTQMELRSPENQKNQKTRKSEYLRLALLVDDVVTTGSTFREAANVLKRNGFGKVYGVALAQD